MKWIIQIFIIVVIGLSFVGCSGCKDPDPCEGQKSFKIEIQASRILHPDNFEQLTMVSDSFYWGRHIHFEAVGSEASDYLWKVGADQRSWVTQSFDLSFDSDFVGVVPVTLITKHEPILYATPQTTELIQY